MCLGLEHYGLGLDIKELGLDISGLRKLGQVLNESSKLFNLSTSFHMIDRLKSRTRSVAAVLPQKHHKMIKC